MIDQPYVDDQTIPDNAELWRRIVPQWAVRDNNAGSWRVSSAAFSDSRDGSPLSVLLAEAVVKSNRSFTDILAEFEGYYLVTFSAGSARELSQGIARTPIPEEPAHASVFGQKTKAVQRGLARACSWVVGPRD